MTTSRASRVGHDSRRLHTDSSLAPQPVRNELTDVTCIPPKSRVHREAELPSDPKHSGRRSYSEPEELRALVSHRGEHLPCCDHDFGLRGKRSPRPSLAAPDASQEPGCCKHQGSSHRAPVRLPVADNLGQRRTIRQHGPSGPESGRRGGVEVAPGRTRNVAEVLAGERTLRRRKRSPGSRALIRGVHLNRGSRDGCRYPHQVRRRHPGSV
jgi:hypothetical protein